MLTLVSVLCKPWIYIHRQEVERTLNSIVSIFFTSLFAQRSDARSDRNRVLSAVEKQCSLSFSGSVAFNLRQEDIERKLETGERKRQVVNGERERVRVRESMISPSACFNSVSRRSSDPFVMLSHGEI